MAVQLAGLDVMNEFSLTGGRTLTPVPWLEEVKRAEQLIYFQSLRKISRYPEEEEKNQTPDIQGDYEEICSAIRELRKSFKVEMESKELEQESLLCIVSKFSKVEKVKSIYLQRYREELQIQILLSITQYESDLMDILLDIEYDIRKRYPEIVFEFFYPPVGMADKKDFIHPQAECIYAR